MLNIFQPFFDNNKLPLILVLFTLTLAVTVWLIFPYDEVLNLVEENGLVESLTIVFYVTTLILLWNSRVRVNTPRYTYLSANIVILAMMLREMDMHKYISGVSMFKLTYWTHHYPLTEKLISLFIIMIIVSALIYLFFTHKKRCLLSIKTFTNEGITIIVFFVVLISSKIIDRSLNMMTEIYGWHADIWMKALQISIEEHLELTLPLLIMIYIYQVIFCQKRIETPLQLTTNTHKQNINEL